MKMFRIPLLAGVAVAAALFVPQASPALGATYAVDTTSDASLTACTLAAADCSLRGAITTANGTGAGDVITFDAGVFSPGTIALGSTLPSLSGGGDTIDGTGAVVLIDATGEAPTFACLTISSAGNTVKGVQVTDCFAAILLNSAASDGNTIGPGNTFFDNHFAIDLAVSSADGNSIIGNKIGTNVSGGAIPAEGGNAFGILIPSANNLVGGATAAARNIISGNSTGVWINGAAATGNIVTGNYIGTDIGGTVDLGNLEGVRIDSGASGNTVGGLLPGQANVISENDTINVVIDAAHNNVLAGNIIGPHVNGSGVIIPREGVTLQAGATGNTVGPRNVISGNVVGVRVNDSGTQGNSIKGNKIGTNLAGTAGVPNLGGVVIQLGAKSNIVGGTAAGDGNVIAFNSLDGVQVSGVGTTGNSIRGNSIHDNGPELNNASGGNLELLPPILTSTAGGTAGGVACALCTVDIFSDGSTDARYYEGSVTAAGDGSFTFNNDSPFIGDNVTATNTDAAGNTSELTTSIAVDSDGDVMPDVSDPDDDNDGMADASDSCRIFPEDYDGYEDADGCPDTDNDADGIADTSDVGKHCFDPANTLACPTTDCRNVAEDIDAFKDADGCPEPDNDNDGFPDATDQCPGTSSQAGPDGMLGSPQDANHTGVQDGAEPTLTTDDIVKTFEDYDLVLNTDGCHDSPGEDFDGDGYTDDDEALFIGTDPGYPCGINGWPSNLNDGGTSANRLDILDVTSFVAPVRHFDRSPGDPGFDARWDIKPGTTGFPKQINITDVTTLVAGPTGNPPMLNGARAFGKDCPLPP